MLNHAVFNFSPGHVSDESISLHIDLDIVQHIAGVRLIHKDLGMVWTAPWHPEIPRGLLKPRNNILEIDVTNVWANRLIGDEQEPPDCEWIPG